MNYGGLCDEDDDLEPWPSTQAAAISINSSPCLAYSTHIEHHNPGSVRNKGKQRKLILLVDNIQFGKDILPPTVKVT